jgi:Outer membrane cytochrome MtrC/MtrF-like, domains II/IV
MNNKKYLSFLLVVAFTVFPLYANAAKGGGPNNAKSCLACHADKTLTKKLMNKEILSLSIDTNKFNSSVHSKAGCGGCHPDITMENHPVVKQIISRKEYSAHLSRNCSACHTAEQLRKRQPIHSSLAAKGTCVGCHGSHYIMGIAAEKVGIKENVYCTTCHRNRISMTMNNGEGLSVYVDESAIQNSAHGKLQCTECHTGFSKSQHPVRSFESLRAYSVAMSEMCGKCHAESFKQYETSVHLDKLKAGDPKAPACSDCHGGHSIVSPKKDKNIGITSCIKCHGDMNSSYVAGIHGKARMRGNEKAPSCSSCHNAHNIESAAASTKIKEGCLKCHKDAGRLHSKWLWNPPVALASFAAAHFDVVSCATCHSPGAAQGVYLTLYNRKTDKPLTEAELMKVFQADAAGLQALLDPDKNGVISAKEVWDIFEQAIRKGKITIFMAKMDVSNAAEAHNIGAKATAIKDCVQCHHPEAALFKNVFIVLKKNAGKPMVIKADREVLNSLYTILPVSKFYALGSSSSDVLDILFIVALLGGLAVPIGHISLRVITSPIRSLRKMGKGGKK